LRAFFVLYGSLRNLPFFSPFPHFAVPFACVDDQWIPPVINLIAIDKKFALFDGDFRFSYNRPPLRTDFIERYLIISDFQEYLVSEVPSCLFHQRSVGPQGRGPRHHFAHFPAVLIALRLAKQHARVSRQSFPGPLCGEFGRRVAMSRSSSCSFS
jgi:hypothetical protein